MKKFEDQIHDYFEKEPIPELDESADEKFKELVLKNKKPTKTQFWKRFSLISAASICLLVCLLLPIFFKKPNQPIEKFYTDIEATKETMTTEEFNSFISSNYPQYSFLTTDFSFSSAIAYYTPENKELLAVGFEINENEDPFTCVKIYLVLKNNFAPTNRESYLTNATCEKTDKYTLYKKTITNEYEENMLGHIIYSNFSIYFDFDCVNEQLLNKFL